jgi:hypothetical protein
MVRWIKLTGVSILLQLLLPKKWRKCMENAKNFRETDSRHELIQSKGGI